MTAEQHAQLLANVPFLDERDELAKGSISTPPKIIKGGVVMLVHVWVAR